MREKNSIWLAVILATALSVLFVSIAVSAQTYKVTVTTNQPSYSGTEAVNVMGAVSPSPGASQAVSFTLTTPSNQMIPIGIANINASTGDFVTSFNTGGPYFSSAGTYTLTAQFDGILGNTTFTYTPVATTTSSASSTTSTTTSTSSSSSSSTTSVATTSSSQSTPTTSETTSTSTTSSSVSSSSSSTSSSTQVPEFPFQLLAGSILVAAIVMSYVLVRHRTSPVVRKS